MNWDSIKYIFQIPLSWYRKIHNMVFHAYGSNFLTVREGYYGGMEIGIDSDGFSDAVGQLGYGKVKTVDGHEPDSNGNVSFGLTGSKWLKSDATGHISTTDEDPVSIDDSEIGYLYNNNGTLEYKDEEYVTIDTDQIITGEKTFESAIGISDGANALSAIYEESTGLVIVDPLKVLTQSPTISFTNATNTGHIDFDPRYGGIEIYTYSGRGGGGYIDFHTDGTSADYSSRIIDLTNEFSLRAVSKPLYLYSYNGNAATGIAIGWSGSERYQLLTDEPARLYSTGADNQIATRGYCRLNFAKASDLDDYITQSALETILLNYVTSTDLGTTLQNYVTNTSLSTILQDYATTTWVQSQNYLTSSDLTNYVTTSDLQTTLQDYATQQDLTSLENTVDDLGDDVTELSTDVESLKLDCVKSVDGHLPTNGAVSFGLVGNKWLKSDGSGHIVTTNDDPLVPSTSSSGYIYNNNGTVSYTSLTANKWVKTTANGLLTTTDDVPVTVNPQSSGYLYNNAGTLQYKDDEYVTLDTAQTITGVKTFHGDGTNPSAQINLGLGAFINATALSTYPNTSTQFAGHKIALQQGNNYVGFAYADSGISLRPAVPACVFTNGNSTQHSGGIYRDTGVVLLVPESLHIEDTHGISLECPANKAVLANHPTDTSTSSKAIATVGYCQSQFGGSGGGTVKSVDHVSPDAQGNVQLNAIRTINGHNGDSVGNFAGVVTSINGNTPTDGAVTMTVVQSVDGVGPDANGEVTLNAVKTVNSISPDASGNVEIEVVKSVDGHSPDTNGAVSFGLTASKWVKTDSSGHLTTTNDKVVTIASNQTGQTTNITVVTGVTWSGTQLVVARKQLNFSNGVLTSTTNLTNTTIDTVAYSPT